MPNGTVKFFNAAKKFGFVSPDDGGKDVFVPVAAVAAAGISALKAGQRVSFETVPDGKGPKVVNLKLIEAAPSPPSAAKMASPIPKEEGRAQEPVFYYNPDCDHSNEMLAQLRASGFEPRVVDYVAAPPDREELKKLSLILREGSLVRRYDPLFHDLRLDDRFISQNEFWDGIVENPTLINGPIVAAANSACICRSEHAVEHFLASVFPGRIQPVVEKKAIAEHTAAPAAEIGMVKLVASDATAKRPEISHAGTTAPIATALAKKKSKAAPKAIKKVSALPTVGKTAKKAVRKPALKSGHAKTK